MSLSPQEPRIVWQTQDKNSEYESLRRGVFNAIVPERYPKAIVQPTTVEEIVGAVHLANRLGCRVAIRSGGHSWACWSIRDNSVLVDLRSFHHLAFNETTGIVEASPSTTGSQMDTFLKDSGRIVLAGHCGDVGLGGFLLQGGMGLNCRGFGATCEYVSAIDVVTSSGEFLHCDASENADLYWASRGAGPGFPAIVTRFYLRTRPRHPVLSLTSYAWPVSLYDQVMPWLLEVLELLDHDIEPTITGTVLPNHGKVILVRFNAWAASLDEARLKIAPVIESRPRGTVMAQECVENSIPLEYEFALVVNPKGPRYIADDVYLKPNLPSAQVVSLLKDPFTHFLDTSIVFIEPMMPTSRRQLPDMALSLMSDFYVAIYAKYDDAKEDAKHQAFVQSHMRKLEPYSTGAYLGDADFTVRPTKFWSDDAHAKLTAVRKRWDPQGKICGYLDKDDRSGAAGLSNVLESEEISLDSKL
ncbi:hypothetical protein NW761_006237 [Fusarium oxysporum]|nr:hypothetical protein NW758_009354 [Fusarium oxysporum]KAJ4092024.1 hypothetical protein NW761_006237 [Fusarium oxysporum]KAJ4113046.1 hypothetical protein NW769_006077 [Fusarium oxysporum]KAJ4235337.1 hypothetical protein NW760_004877 [Fusarium oxysporum]